MKYAASEALDPRNFIGFEEFRSYNDDTDLYLTDEMMKESPSLDLD